LKSPAKKNGKQAPQSVVPPKQDDGGEDEERREYLEERKLLIDLHNQACQSFDKTVILLAGGALGLSITFIQQIAPHPSRVTLPMLAWSWGSLVLALLVILLSLFTSQVGMQRAQHELELEYYSGTLPVPPKRFLLRVCDGFGAGFTRFFGWRPLTSILNFFAIVFTIVGIMLLAWFSIQNVYHIG
jgi:hypothetical protein